MPNAQSMNAVLHYALTVNIQSISTGHMQTIDNYYAYEWFLSDSIAAALKNSCLGNCSVLGKPLMRNLDCARLMPRKPRLKDIEKTMCCCKALVPSMALDTLSGLHNQYRIDAEQVQMQRGENMITSSGTLSESGNCIKNGEFILYYKLAKCLDSKLNIGS